MAQRNPARPLPHVRNQFRPVSDWVGYVNDMVVCPYNSSHVMKYHKLMGHLMKCEKQLKAGTDMENKKGLPNGYEKCPYDSLHRYPSGKHDEHFRVCRARGDEFMARINAGLSIEGLDERYMFLKKTDSEKEQAHVQVQLQEGDKASFHDS